MRVVSKTILPILFLFICLFNLKAQTVESYTDTIPYEIKRGKIILTLNIDDKPARFLFDTGGRNLIVYDSLSIYPSISLTGQNEGIADFNGISSSLPKAIAKEVGIGKRSIKNAPFIVSPNNNSFKAALGISGLISGELFKDFSVKINSRKKVITLSYPFRPKGMSRKDGIRINMDSNFRPIIPLTIGSSTINALFDTGAVGFLLLSEKDCNTLNDAGSLQIDAKGKGIISIGQGGMKNAVPSPILKYNIKEVAIKDKKFIEVGGLTIPGYLSIIGYDLLSYGEILIDYPRNLFYFLPYEKEPINKKETTKEWNVKILPVGYDFEITAVIGNVDVEIGEKVWEINGLSTKNFKPDELELIETMEKINKEEIILLVGKNKETARKIAIKKL